MRSFLKFGAVVLVLSLVILTPSVQAAKKATTEDQVAVLLKWYQTYLDEGNYKQAKQAAELAYELAPDNPEAAVALKLARRLQVNSVQVSNGYSAQTEAQLVQVLQKLDRVERQLRQMKAQRRQQARVQIAKEPPGSPDSNY
jgi:hypothetical protein